jgi:hypothetical protein
MDEDTFCNPHQQRHATIESFVLASFILVSPTIETDDDRKFVELIEQALVKEQNSGNLIESKQRKFDQRWSVIVPQMSSGTRNRTAMNSVTTLWMILLLRTLVNL